MRIFLVALIMSFSLLLGSTGSAKAMPCGAGAVSAVLAGIPPALETFKYYEDIKVKCKRWSCDFFTKCKTFTLLKDLKDSLTAFCGIIDTLEGFAPPIPIVTAMNGKLSSIGSALGAVGSASSIKDPAKLGSYIDGKMLSIDGDMKDLFGLMPKLEIKNTEKWIKIGKRDSCKTKPAPGGTTIGSTTYTDAPPTAKEKAAGDAALAYSKAQNKVEVLQYKVIETKADIAAKKVEISNAEAVLATIVAKPPYYGKAADVAAQTTVVNGLKADLVTLEAFLVTAKSDLAAAIIVRDAAKVKMDAANAALTGSL